MDGLAILYVVFCFIVCGFGIWVYSKRKDDVPLYIGVAYGLFTIDRLIVLLSSGSGLNILGIVLRIVAYLLLLFALYRAFVKNRK
ncbi:hypothetical protein ACFLVN_01085 [Chloroflexota bacterium]